jgi:signal peptidase I
MTFPFSRKTTDEQPEAKAGSGRAFFWELIQVIAISLAIVIPIRYFIAAPFYVKGASMEPNFYDHEYLLIDEMTYRFSDPQRGDIVVFHHSEKDDFIKRVIGLPGETVEVAGGKVKIFNAEHENGMILPEQIYLDQKETGGTKTVTLKSDEYFLMGDNRAVSLDSRIIGPVKRSAIVGRVWVRGFPIDRWKWFSTPIYPTSTSSGSVTISSP